MYWAQHFAFCQHKTVFALDSPSQSFLLVFHLSFYSPPCYTYPVLGMLFREFNVFIKGLPLPALHIL